MIRDNKSNQWSSVCYRTEVKCIIIDSIIKYIGFESFHYAISLNVVSSFMVLRNFDYMFLSMYW